jgi:hypothetical protein
MAVTFRFAVPGEYSKISKFLNEFWARDHIYCRNEKLFEWTFNRPTHWQPGEYSFAVAEEDGELVGILGGIPFTFNHFGKESRGVWIVNYVIGPDHRKGPVALKLLSTFRRPDIDPVIAFGITQATTVIYKVLRGRVLPPIPRSFLLLPEGKERFGRLLKVVYPDWSDDRTASLASAFSKEIEQGQTVSAGEGIPATWDETDWPTIAQTTVGAVRNSDYLTWRYRDHPVFEYRFLSIPEGNGLAFGNDSEANGQWARRS